jgi:hypothetical protein
MVSSPAMPSNELKPSGTPGRPDDPVKPAAE